MKQSVVALDLEGVLVPEIWIAVAEKTGIPALRRTTRDEPDYDKLMQGRIEILDKHHLTLDDIQTVIATMQPLPGALEFLNDLRELTQVVILSDTFEEFAKPIMRQLGWPTLFCHQLVLENGRITGYKLRQPEPKKNAVRALQHLRYFVVAAGDSFNDVAMLNEANAGFLFHAPEAICKKFPKFPAIATYPKLLAAIKQSIAR